MESSAEEFFSRRLADAQVLLDAAHRHAGKGDAVSAVGTMLASDVATLQALLWERINVAPRAPLRQLFQAAEALTSTMAGFADEQTPEWTSAADLVGSARHRMMLTLDDALASAAAGRWSDLGFLSPFAVPMVEDLEDSLSQRTGGLTVTGFILQRRAEASQVMVGAQADRVRGATSQAITAAYDSDFLSLEAYLAESAWLLGDVWLLTAIARWDLATHAVSTLTRLPDGFVDAVALVRRTMTEALGDADGSRLSEVFEPT